MLVSSLSKPSCQWSPAYIVSWGHQLGSVGSGQRPCFLMALESSGGWHHGSPSPPPASHPWIQQQVKRGEEQWRFSAPTFMQFWSPGTECHSCLPPFFTCVWMQEGVGQSVNRSSAHSLDFGAAWKWAEQWALLWQELQWHAGELGKLMQPGAQPKGNWTTPLHPHRICYCQRDFQGCSVLA